MWTLRKSFLLQKVELAEMSKKPNQTDRKAL